MVPRKFSRTAVIAGIVGVISPRLVLPKAIRPCKAYGCGFYVGLWVVVVLICGLIETQRMKNPEYAAARRKAAEVATAKEATKAEAEKPAKSEVASPQTEREKLKRMMLNVSASCSGGRVVIQNRSMEDWLEPQIHINDDWFHIAKVIKAGQTYKILSQTFINGSNISSPPLDLRSVECKNIRVTATVNGEFRFWDTGMDEDVGIEKPAKREAATAREGLNASAGCTNGRVLVQNMGAEHWLEVKIEVNSQWTHSTDVVEAGQTYRYFPNIFTNGGGTRLDLDQVACKTIDIHATVNGVRANWNGAVR